MLQLFWLNHLCPWNSLLIAEQITWSSWNVHSHSSGLWKGLLHHPTACLSSLIIAVQLSTLAHSAVVRCEVLASRRCRRVLAEAHEWVNECGGVELLTLRGIRRWCVISPEALAAFSLQQTQTLRLKVFWHYQYVLTHTGLALPIHRLAYNLRGKESASVCARLREWVRECRLWSTIWGESSTLYVCVYLCVV